MTPGISIFNYSGDLRLNLPQPPDFDAIFDKNAQKRAENSRAE